MSRIGKLPIEIPAGVTVSVDGKTVKVTSQKGEMELVIDSSLKVVVEDNAVKVEKKLDTPEAAGLWGLTRTLIFNMIKGVSEGFKKVLEINGIGYRAAVSGSKLTLNLGYSHPIEFIAPEGVSLAVEKNTIIVSGMDKQKVGQAAAEIRAFRKPEPYKGKGVKYQDEHIRRKAGKTGAK